MDAIFENVILSDVLQDEERFRKIIDAAIKEKDVPSFPAYVKESKAKRAARVRRAKEEAGEAEEYAKELGVHDEIFGKNGKKSKKSSEDSLAALIQKRQQSRSESFLDNLAEKYGAVPKGKKSKKRAAEEEPDEEAFQAAAAKLKQKKSKK